MKQTKKQNNSEGLTLSFSVLQTELRTKSTLCFEETNRMGIGHLETTRSQPRQITRRCQRNYYCLVVWLFSLVRSDFNPPCRWLVVHVLWLRWHLWLVIISYFLSLLQTEYLDIVKQWPYYGTTFFPPCKSLNNRNLPAKVLQFFCYSTIYAPHVLTVPKKKKKKINRSS